MGLRTIATGGIWNLHTLGDYDEQFEEGDEGVIDFTLRFIPPGNVVELLEATLLSSGVTLTRAIEVTTHSEPHLEIHFEKRLGALVYIAIAIAAAIAIFALIIAWKISQVSPGIITGLATGTLILIIVGVIVAVVVIAISGRFAFGKMRLGK